MAHHNLLVFVVLQNLCYQPHIDKEEIIEKLKPLLKKKTQLVQINKSPPLFWIYEGFEDGKHIITRYKTETMRTTLGINSFTSFYETPLYPVFLPEKYLFNFEIREPNKLYTDNKPHERSTDQWFWLSIHCLRNISCLASLLVFQNRGDRLC